MYFDADFASNHSNQCLYQNKNPTILPCQIGNTFFIKHISQVGCGHRIFFVGMAIFPIFLILEEHILSCWWKIRNQG